MNRPPIALKRLIPCNHPARPLSVRDSQSAWRDGHSLQTEIPAPNNNQKTGAVHRLESYSMPEARYAQRANATAHASCSSPRRKSVRNTRQNPNSMAQSESAPVCTAVCKKKLCGRVTIILYGISVRRYLPTSFWGNTAAKVSGPVPSKIVRVRIGSVLDHMYPRFVANSSRPSNNTCGAFWNWSRRK